MCRRERACGLGLQQNYAEERSSGCRHSQCGGMAFRAPAGDGGQFARDGTARIAHAQQEGLRCLVRASRRRVRIARRRSENSSAAYGWRSLASELRRSARTPAGPAAGPLRYSLRSGHPGEDAVAREQGPALWAGRFRHEVGHRADDVRAVVAARGDGRNASAGESSAGFR